MTQQEQLDLFCESWRPLANGYYRGTPRPQTAILASAMNVLLSSVPLAERGRAMGELLLRRTPAQGLTRPDGRRHGSDVKQRAWLRH